MIGMLKRNVAMLSFAAGLCLAPLVATAGTPLTYTDEGQAIFKLTVPDFWSVRTGGIRDLTEPGGETVKDVSRVLGMTPEAHDGIWVGFVSPHDLRTLAEGRDYLREIGKFIVMDPDISSVQSRTISGMPGQTISGTGRRDGRTLSFTAVIVDLPNGRIVVSVVVFEAGADPDVVGDINQMMSSIKALR